MENQKIVSYGTDMLNANDQALGNTEVKTPSPLSSSADRSINEEEENPVRSESSSGASSPSDLRKRLQDLPSPNETARLANRVINISRRLSRKRDLYFHGATNRIEENDEQEEQSHPGRRSFNDFKVDARARRRAKIRLESGKHPTMVVSQPGEGNASQLKDTSNDDEQSSRSSAVESLKQDALSLKSSGVDESSNYLNQYLPLSSRTPPIFSPFRNYAEDNQDSPKSQRNAQSRPCLSLSSENSPRSRIDLQPVSPMSLGSARPTKFGGYRPHSGVILQNLSSGSEPESSREIMPERIMPPRMIDNSNAVAPSINFHETLNTSTVFSHRSNSQSFGECSPTVPLSAKRSLTVPEVSNRAFVDTTSNDRMENVFPIVENDIQNSNERLSSTPSYLRQVTREPSFYRLPSTPRSDCGPNLNNFQKIVDEPMFLSARNDVRDYDKRSVEKPLFLLEPSISGDTNQIPNQIPHQIPNILREETSGNVQYNVPNFENKYFEEETQRKYQGMFNEANESAVYEMPFSNEFSVNSSRSKSYMKEDHSELSTPGSFPLGSENSERSKNDFEKSVYGNTPQDGSEMYGSNVLKQVASTCFLGNSVKKHIKYPLSARTIRKEPEDMQFSARYKGCYSEGNSATSSSKEFFTNKFKGNAFSEDSVTDNQEFPSALTSQVVGNTSNRKDFANIPTLVFNSQEMSYSTSPGSKTCSDKHLDANALIMALSNMSLQQQISKNILKNTYRVPSDDDETERSTEKDVVGLNLSKTMLSRSEENHNTSDKSRISSMTSISKPSKIPVKVSSSKQVVTLNANEFSKSKEELAESETTSIDSNSQNFQNVSPSLELQLDSERIPISQSRENLSVLQNATNSTFRESNSMSSSSADVYSKEQSKHSDPRYTPGVSQNCSESENTARSHVMVKRICSKNYLNSLDNERCVNDRYECKDQEQIQTSRSDFSNNPKFCEPPINQPVMIDDDTISSNCSYAEKVMEHSDRTDHALSMSEPINSNFPTPHCHENNEFALIKEFENSEYLVRNKSESSMIHEINEETTEKRKGNLLENQMGDDGSGEILKTKPKQLQLEQMLDSSSESEKFEENKILINNHESNRFSLERLAAEQFRKTICPDETKNIQSETSAFFAEKFYDGPSFSSSTSKLYYSYDKTRDYSPRFKKRSQDRFPFTISEKTSTASMKYKIPARLGSLDEDAQFLEKTYKLDTHPSITRLAGRGFEDTPADIITYAAYTEQQDRRARSSGMKGFVQKVSAKLKKSKKLDESKKSTKAANVLYENRAYRDDSVAGSCSESSLMKEFTVHEKILEKPRVAEDSPDKESSIILDKKSVNIENFQSTDSPCRSRNRDDLWVQELRNYNSMREEEIEASGTPKNADESEKDPYSVFFVKSTSQTPDTSGRTSERHNVSTDAKRNRVKFRNNSLIVMAEQSGDDAGKKITHSRNMKKQSRRKKNKKTGCLCMRFYRMIVRASFGSVPKSRSRISHSTSLSSVEKRSHFSPRERKG